MAEVILKASLEVRSSIVYATAIVIVAITPVFFLEGVAGAFSGRWLLPMPWPFWSPWWWR